MIAYMIEYTATHDSSLWLLSVDYYEWHYSIGIYAPEPNRPVLVALDQHKKPINPIPEGSQHSLELRYINDCKIRYVLELSWR